MYICENVTVVSARQASFQDLLATGTSHKEDVHAERTRRIHKLMHAAGTQACCKAPFKVPNPRQSAAGRHHRAGRGVSHTSQAVADMSWLASVQPEHCQKPASASSAASGRLDGDGLRPNLASPAYKHVPSVAPLAIASLAKASIWPTHSLHQCPACVRTPNSSGICS